MAASDLYDACVTLLAACMDALDWTERAYVSNGLPAYDCCPQLTVHAAAFNRDYIVPTPGSLSPRIASARRTDRGSMNAVPLVVTVLECVPTVKASAKTKIEFPDPADLDASSQLMMGDAWVLWNALQTMKRDGTLFGGRCTPTDFGPATPITDQGGCGGWAITVIVQIDGYAP